MNNTSNMMINIYIFIGVALILAALIGILARKNK